MEGKTKQWLLLGLVVVIWAIVIYRFVDLTEEEEGLVTPIRTTRDAPTQTKQAEYHFHLNYRDPFIKTFEQTMAPVDRGANPPRRREVNPPIRQRVPMVIYQGMVSDAKTSIGIVMINNNRLMLTSGDEQGDFTVVAVRPEEILLKYHPIDSILHYPLTSGSPDTKNRPQSSN